MKHCNSMLVAELEFQVPCLTIICFSLRQNVFESRSISMVLNTPKFRGDTFLLISVLDWAFSSFSSVNVSFCKPRSRGDIFSHLFHSIHHWHPLCCLQKAWLPQTALCRPISAFLLPEVLHLSFHFPCFLHLA